jgi:hypothetical protein
MLLAVSITILLYVVLFWVAVIRLYRDRKKGKHRRYRISTRFWLYNTLPNIAVLFFMYYASGFHITEIFTSGFKATVILYCISSIFSGIFLFLISNIEFDAIQLALMKRFRLTRKKFWIGFAVVFLLAMVGLYALISQYTIEKHYAIEGNLVVNDHAIRGMGEIINPSSFPSLSSYRGVRYELKGDEMTITAYKSIFPPISTLFKSIQHRWAMEQEINGIKYSFEYRGDFTNIKRIYVQGYDTTLVWTKENGNVKPGK